MPESLLDPVDDELEELGVEVAPDAVDPVLVDPVLVDPVVGEVVAVEAELVDPVVGVIVVSVVLFELDASAVLATPEIRPRVTAAVETAATAAAVRPRIRRRSGVSLGFIPTTMLRGGSGGPHHRVKKALSLAGMLRSACARSGRDDLICS